MKNPNPNPNPSPEQSSSSMTGPQAQLMFHSAAVSAVAVQQSEENCSAGPAGRKGRLFYPTNREDILLQLSSLAISADFPPGLTAAPVKEDGLVFLEDGLRTDEVPVLQSGRKGRFPVLIELAPSAASVSGVFGLHQINALYFRDKDEAEEFRFRPVDELDTQVLDCRIEPSLFDLRGSARFQNGASVALPRESRGYFADRIAGGVCSVLEFGKLAPDCWHEIADFLCGGPVVPSAGLTLALAFAAGCSLRPEAGHAAAVVRAFIANDAGDSPGTLIENIYSNLAGAVADDAELRVAERWMSVANDLINNRMRLETELLSDEGMVSLRAALLAAVVDDVRMLVPFLNNPEPVGRKVLIAAAFLIGSRYGVMAMSWKAKSRWLCVLSPMIVALREASAGAWEDMPQAFHLEPDETASELIFRLFWSEHELVSWNLDDSQPRPAQDVAGSDVGSVSDVPLTSCSDTSGEFHTSDETEMKSAESASLKCIHDADGRAVDVLFENNGLFSGATLRYALSGPERLRRPKEVLEISSTAGLLWRAGAGAGGLEALYADLPHWPDDALQGELLCSLSTAIGAYVLKRKLRTSAGSGLNKKAKAGKSEPKVNGSDCPDDPECS